MILRTSTIACDPRRLAERLPWLRVSVVPQLAALPGNVGVLVLVGEQAGRVVVASLWGTPTRMAADEPVLDALREQACAVPGTTVTTESWEVVERHRRRPLAVGATDRSTRIEFPPADVDLLVETFRSTTLPATDLLPMLCGTTLLVDRSRGVAVWSATFTSHSAMTRSRRAAAEIRQMSMEKARARPVEVTELTVAIAEAATRDGRG
ncbi:MAG: hypothetical protein QOI54_2600 [Actinomycetota bacterium]|jgi:hypothetical protein|nr:hypothetical protein [Actinomycetota bacterium]